MTDLFEVVPSGKIRNWFQSLSVIVRLFISLTADDLFSRLSLHKTIFFTKRVFFHLIPLNWVLGYNHTLLLSQIVIKGVGGGGGVLTHLRKQ